MHAVRPVVAVLLVVLVVVRVMAVRIVRGADHDDAAAHAHHVDGRAVERAQHLGVEDLVGRADAEPAAHEVQHPVDHVEHRVDVVGDEHDRRVGLPAVPVDQLADHALVPEVEAEERLVAEEEPRIRRQGLGHAQPLLLPAGESGDRGVGVRGGAHGVEQLVDPGALGPPADRQPQRWPVTPKPTRSRARTGVAAVMSFCCGM